MELRQLPLTRVFLTLMQVAIFILCLVYLVSAIQSFTSVGTFRNRHLELLYLTNVSF